MSGAKTAAASSAEQCVHCLLPIPRGGRVTEMIDGAELAFCCHGCRIAYRVIQGAGLGEFYRKRRWKEPGAPPGAYEMRYDAGYLDRFVVRHSDGDEIMLLIDGVRCASCVWVIEKILEATEGVKSARISYSNHLLKIVFDSEIIYAGDLLTRLSRIGYPARPYTPSAAEENERRENRKLMMRFGAAAFLSLQLMGFSIALYGGYFHGIDESSRILLRWLAFAAATPVVFYSGGSFLSGGLRSVKNRTGDMDLLISIGVLAAYGYSVGGLLTGGDVYFDSAAMIITFLLVGRIFENLARGRAASGINRLLSLAPATAHLIDGERIIDVDGGTLSPGQFIQVLPGERFPADGEIIEGITEVDQAALTGEPYPTERGPTARVLSGTLNISAAVKVRVTRAGADSFISRMANLVREAQMRKPPVHRLADRLASMFVPVVLFIAFATFIGWGLSGAPAGEALVYAISVLVVACPCALGLATPTAIVVASGAASARGIIYRGGDILEKLAGVTSVYFDKTGTLTLGKMKVAGIDPAEGIGEKELIQTIVVAESGSAHPIARAIVEYAESAGLEIGAGSSQNYPGRGIEFISDAGVVRIGSKKFLAEAGVRAPEWDERIAEVMAWAACGDRFIGRVRLTDRVRPEARNAVRAFDRLGLRSTMLTGDGPESGRTIAADCGIEEVFAEVDPAGKAAIVEAVRARGERVLMVGDGINDAAALAAAEVGATIGGATDVALETADLIIVAPDLLRLPEAVRISRATIAVIKQNLGWAFVYNVGAIFLASSGRLAPIFAAAAMAASSICVLANSLRLSRITVKRGADV